MERPFEPALAPGDHPALLELAGRAAGGRSETAAADETGLGGEAADAVDLSPDDPRQHLAGAGDGPPQFQIRTDSNASHSVYKYHPTELRLLSETHPVGGTAIERVHTRSYDTVGRPDGFDLGTSGDPDIDHSVTYGYDLAGRPYQVTGAGKTFAYGYTANSYDLIGTVTGPVGIGVTNTWESNRDVPALSKIQTAPE